MFFLVRITNVIVYDILNSPLVFEESNFSNLVQIFNYLVEHHQCSAFGFKFFGDRTKKAFSLV